MQDQLTGSLAGVLQETGFALQPERALFRITGEDATRWLNGMVTNSIQALAPGEGVYSFLLNAQGRIQGDCFLFRDPAAPDAEFLLLTDRGQMHPIREHLDRFIIMDDVELAPETEDTVDLLVFGAHAPQALAGLKMPSVPPGHLAYADTSKGRVMIFAHPGERVPRVELLGDAAAIQSLEQQLRGAGVVSVDAEELERLRVLEGVPRYGVDIRDRDLPQETAQAHALHFAKGCYVGQEIVERIRSRGQVHRVFTAFRLEGEPPVALPAALEARGKAAGELTSVRPLSTAEGDVWLALGYARREFLDTQAVFTYEGGQAQPRIAGTLGSPVRS